MTHIDYIGDEGYNLEPERNDYPIAYVHDFDSSHAIVLRNSDDDAVWYSGVVSW